LEIWAKARTDGKSLETPSEPSGVEETAWLESMVWNWRDPTPLKRSSYKPDGEIDGCGEGVRGVHSTVDAADNKTAVRKGTLLHSSYPEEVRASECRNG
jgi:hypothetical protein